MSKQLRKKKKKSSKKEARRRDYRRRQRSVSIYFLLWAAFSALALFVVLVFGITQRVVLTKTYKKEAALEIREKGVEIQRRVDNAFENGVPPEFKGNTSLYLRTLSALYDVQIFVLAPDGEVLFPQVPVIEGENSESLFDFTTRIQTLLAELDEKETRAVVYEGEGEYVYGAKMSVFDHDAYLYLSRSLDLMTSVSRQIGTRTVVLGVFVFVLSFALSSAFSGWLTRPLREMTGKAERLAHGDFAVDFHGNDYGQEMFALADTLNFTRDELSKTDRMQKEVIANVSHDFKTPLTMIKAYASMIMEISGEDKQKREKHAQIIVDEADRLASLVGDVLELSKMQAGITPLKEERMDMSAHLKETMARFDFLKETENYRFEMDVEEGLYTIADKVQIGQALYNLISNAVNYTGEDKRVHVALQRVDEHVFRFSVSDTGNGIKEEDLANIWERYYRSSEMHKRPIKGTGLGLSIVKSILERHHFAFGADSTLHKGTTFFVDFPLDK